MPTREERVDEGGAGAEFHHIKHCIVTGGGLLFPFQKEVPCFPTDAEGGHGGDETGQGLLRLPPQLHIRRPSPGEEGAGFGGRRSAGHCCWTTAVCADGVGNGEKKPASIKQQLDSGVIQHMWRMRTGDWKLGKNSCYKQKLALF